MCGFYARADIHLPTARADSEIAAAVETHGGRRPTQIVDMNGGRVAKRLLAVVLALSTLVTLGLYYNGLSTGGGVWGGGRTDDRPQPQPAALLPAIEWSQRPEDDSAANDVAPSGPRKRPGAVPQHRPAPMSATVDRDTCPVLGLANTTIDTAAEFSRFEFQVRPI